jgi:poly-beta-1,6-N-acetyl-D-glucosamine synthase
VNEQLPDYVIISPVKDEADYLPRTAESLIAQRHRPLQWVIVDDGSSDATGEIAEAYADLHSWITVVRRPASTMRARGAPIVRAFNAGLEAATDDGEFVVKLDGDLYLPPHYFEWVATTFRDEQRAGIVGGLVLNDYGHRWELDSVNRNNVHGVAKSYRRRCLDDIGGLQQSMGWDGLDEYAARARGWDVRVLSELQVLHFKPRGSKQRWWRARWEEGRGNQFMGYRPTFMFVRVAYRMLVERPPVLGGLVMGASYLWHLLRRAPRVPDELAMRQLRREQATRLRDMLLLRREPARWPTSAGPAHLPVPVPEPSRNVHA